MRSKIYVTYIYISYNDSSTYIGLNTNELICRSVQCGDVQQVISAHIMTDRLIKDIKAFQAKCSALSDLVTHFVNFSATTETRIASTSQDGSSPLKTLRHTIACWFVLYCALHDEFMFLISGDTSCSRHAADKSLYQHSRAAAREVHKGDWLSRCSYDGLNYEIRQVPSKALSRPVSTQQYLSRHGYS